MKPTSPFAAFLSNKPVRPKQAGMQRPLSAVPKAVASTVKQAAPQAAAPVAKQSAPKVAAKQVPRPRQATRTMFTDLLGCSPSASRSMGTGRDIYTSSQPAPRQPEPQQTKTVSDPTALARQIINAGRMARGEIDGPAIKAPPASSMAAQIIAAGKRARGEQ
ncbi:hypothetical protein B7759_02283 [Burkholderia glumae]|uniref:hypothetical protein n=1 Tax=Burkholderia glumae TaxID=337 RepID=UPI001AE9D954|nr:hypothetical protein [Burkholderia glumae]QTP33680.1 hypothetical protein B7759_02283 [Burkholderia glumae]